MTEQPVAIAGGGIAGLSAAIALARAGRDVCIYERELVAAGQGAGVQLSPNASRHLRAWRVLDGLSSTAPERVVIRRARDATILATLPLADATQRWGAPFLLAHRADLHAALTEAVARDARIAVRTGDHVMGWDDDPSQLHVCFDTGRRDEAAALIAADGVRSTARLRLLGNAPVPTGRMAWRALVPSEACPDFAHTRVSNLWLGAAAHLVHYPLRGGTFVNVVAVVADSTNAPEEASWSRPGERSDIAAYFRDWSPHARALIASASEWRGWPLLACAPPRRLVCGRVGLIGDAAHPMMPFLAQGAAQAIEDAAALGDAFARHNDPRAALAAYEKSRLARLRRVVAASERQTRVYHLSGSAAHARDLAMRLAGPLGLRLATGWIYKA